METKLRRIAEIARTKPNERFTSLIHLINAETLMQSHNNIDVIDSKYREIEYKYDLKTGDLIKKDI